MRVDQMTLRALTLASALGVGLGAWGLGHGQAASRMPQTASQDFSSLRPELVSDGFPGGEGPVWSRDGFLLFSDYSRDRIYKYVPGGTPEVYREDSHGTNGNAMDAQGRLYSCEYKSR